MNAVPFAAALLFGSLLALGIVAVRIRFDASAAPISRFAPLDGLRGFAALSVYFHHAAGWRNFAMHGEWSFGSHAAWLVGPTAVSLFFMVTAFLFVDKVVFAPRPTDWLRLYLSRFFRMMPLFLFVFSVVLVIVAVETSEIRESPAALFIHIGSWLPLTIFGAPDINQLGDTWMTVAGATWTLPYECLFYLGLPMIAALAGRRPIRIGFLFTVTLAFLALFIFCIIPQGYDIKTVEERLISFPAGALAAVLVQRPGWRRFACSRKGTALAVAAGLVALYVPAHHSWNYAVLFQAVVFALVAGGNGLGGVLTSKPARRLGDISYSIYLLHGLLLFVTVHYLVGWETVSRMSQGMYGLLIIAMIPVLLIFSDVTYRWVEKPGMAQTDRSTAIIRRWQRPRAAQFTA